MVAEIKKQRYVYYHCTGNRTPHKCPEPYTRQETLVHQFATTLSDLVVPTPILDWLTTELARTDEHEQTTRDATLKRYKAEPDRLQTRLDHLYDDRLDRTITKDTYEQKAHTIRDQQASTQAKITALTYNAPAPLTSAIDALRLTSTACQTFLDQEPTEQRRLLHQLVKNATWKDGRLRTTLLEPFELLRHSNQQTDNGTSGIGGPQQEIAIWLPERDTDPNSRMENAAGAIFSMVLTKTGFSEMRSFEGISFG